MKKRLLDFLYNFLDKFTGENVTYAKVTTYADGTPMTNAKCDGIIYKKDDDTGEYFKRNYKELTPEIFGAKGDGVTDDTEALSKCLNLPFAKTVFLDRTYLITKLTVTSSNLYVRGTVGSSIICNSRKDMIELGDLKDVLFENIRFVNTFQSDDLAYSSAAWGMIYSLNRFIENVTFRGCYFSIPGAYTNALKLVCEQNGFLRNVKIIDSIFENIARMAFEAQNHNNTVDKWIGIAVQNCIFRNLGLIIGTDNGHGMAVSISGMGKDILITNNLVDNALNIGIEVTGGNDNTIVTDNKFINNTRVRAIDNEPFCPLSIDGKLNTSTNKGRVIKAEVRDNVQLDETFNNKLFFRDIMGGNISNNKFYLSGYVILRGVQSSKFINNFYQGNSDRVVYLEGAADTVVRPSINNYFQEVIMSLSSGNAGAYLLSTNVNNNEFNSIISKVAGQNVRDSYNQYNVVRYRPNDNNQMPIGITLPSNANDYTLSEELASYPVLNFNGSPTGQINIFLPIPVASNPLLVVQNSTSQTLRFLGVGGTAGTLVRPGFAEILTYRKNSNDFSPLLNKFGIYPVVGTPEGVIAASPGRIALSDTGLFFKATGTSNTGWIATMEAYTVNTATTAPSKSDLNTAYGTQKAGSVVFYPNITGGGLKYTKLAAGNTSDWDQVSITLVS